MRKLVEIEYLEIEKNKKYEEIANKVFESCFKEEELYNYKIYISIILTDEKNIQNIFCYNIFNACFTSNQKTSSRIWT